MIHLELNKDEALVFFEWLSRLDERDALPVEDPSEKVVLWSLLAQLEKTLVDPLKKDYKVLLQDARKRVKAAGGVA